MKHLPSELDTRREHVRRIRRRVIAGVSGLFLAATGGIAAQLASGHDPALAKAPPPTGSSPAGSSSAGSSSSDSAGTAVRPAGPRDHLSGGAEEYPGPRDGGSGSQPGVAPLTTGQS